MGTTRQRLGRVLLALLLALSSVVGVTLSAQAAEQLDQQQLVISGFAPIDTALWWGQTFQAGLSGDLTKIRVGSWLGADPAGELGDLTMEIRAGDPNGLLLASEVVPKASVPTSEPTSVDDWLSVSFSSPPVVTAGQSYAFVLTTTGASGRYEISGTALDPYPNGDAWICFGGPGCTWTVSTVGDDLAFETYVTVSDYDWSGFLAPVNEQPALNKAKAGSAIPIKFSLGGDQGLDIIADGYPKSVGISCPLSDEIDPIEETVTAGSSGLSYDAESDTYTYVWKTKKSWTGKCRQLILELDDGSQHVTDFAFK